MRGLGDTPAILRSAATQIRVILLREAVKAVAER